MKIGDRVESPSMTGEVIDRYTLGNMTRYVVQVQWDDGSVTAVFESYVSPEEGS